jgi:hypothetical protein
MKIRRARRHILELEDELSRYLSRWPITVTYEPTFGDFIEFSIELKEMPPLDWPAIIGDVVHNLRAALDLLANDLVRLNQKSTKGVYFPFARDASDLDTMIKARNMNRAAPEVVELIRSMAPFSGGNHALRAIHDLDIQDKHQALIIAGSSVDIHGLSLGWRDINGMKVGSLGNGSFRREGFNGSFGQQPVGFRLMFAHDHDTFPDREIAKTLHALTEETLGVIQAFELLCFGAVSE